MIALRKNDIPAPGPEADWRDTTAIIGMGATGRSAAHFLMQRGVRCAGFDEHKVKLPKSLSLPLHIGPLDAARLASCARLVVSPGIRWDHPALVAARDAGVPVAGDLDLFRENYAGELIGVTGTNGKTTTVSLIATMLDVLPGGIESGGNIGTPMLQLLEGASAPRRVVLELSSFQLERARPVRPRWAALLNVQQDHADMHADAGVYEAAKLRLFEHQGEGDTAMLPIDEKWNRLASELTGCGVEVRRFGIGEPTTMDCGVQALAHEQWRIFWRHEDISEAISSDDLPVRGMHQHVNLAIAAQAAADFGVSANVIRQSLTSFRGLPHRLQSLGIVADREWFDDSKATNPEAARAALSSFSHVLWICGGRRKDLDLTTLEQTISEHVEHAFIIGKDAKPFARLLAAAGVSASVEKTVKRAVRKAARAQKGLPVLLSPAAASQDQFHDYIERGNAFSQAVRALETSQ